MYEQQESEWEGLEKREQPSSRRRDLISIFLVWILERAVRHTNLYSLSTCELTQVGLSKHRLDPRVATRSFSEAREIVIDQKRPL
jgi:hypothetical protein